MNELMTPGGGWSVADFCHHALSTTAENLGLPLCICGCSITDNEISYIVGRNVTEAETAPVLVKWSKDELISGNAFTNISDRAFNVVRHFMKMETPPPEPRKREPVAPVHVFGPVA